MTTYEIEMQDGVTYEVDMDDTIAPPQKSKPKIQPSIFETPALEMRRALGEPEWMGNIPFIKKAEEMTEPLRQKVLGAGLGMVNTGLLGIPEIISQKLTGRKLVPHKAPIAETIGSVGGFALGAPGKILEIVNPAIKALIPSNRLTAKLAQAGLLGGTAGLTLLPTPEQAPTFKSTIKQLQTQGAVGAVANAAISFVSNIAPKLINLGGRKTAQVLAEKVDKGMDKLSQGLSDKYDDVLANIKGTVKTQSVVDDIQQTIDEFPEGANAGKLKSIINRIKDNEDISAKELFNIKKEISKTIPKSVWNGVSDADAITNSKEQLYWKITQKLEDVGGDKYKGLTSEYKNFKQSERLARKMFYRQGVPSNVPLGGTYDIPTQRAVRGLSGQLSQEEQFANQFEAWRRGQGVKQIGKRILPWIPAMAGLGYMGSRTMNRGNE